MQAASSSGRIAVIVPKHSTESLATLDPSSDSTDFFARINQLVFEPLVIPFYRRPATQSQTSDTSLPIVRIMSGTSI